MNRFWKLLWKTFAPLAAGSAAAAIWVAAGLVTMHLLDRAGGTGLAFHLLEMSLVILSASWVGRDAFKATRRTMK
jgi:hypothetical protein